MFISDFLSRFSSDNKVEEPIPYLKDTSSLSNDSYMSYLDDMCAYNYDTKQVYYTQHSFPLTHSESKVQKIVLPSLFKSGKTASQSIQRPASVLRDPSTIMTSTRSTAIRSTVLPPTNIRKRGHKDLLIKQSTSHPIRVILNMVIYA